MPDFNPTIPLSLYIHFPWCLKKCPYCDFNSHASPAKGLPENAYIDSLLQDLEQDLPLIWGRRIHSIFMGGGTPSLLSPEAIERLLQGIRARLTYSPNSEITLEANPGTFEQARFSDYHAAGINRLSIGIQSFEDDLLNKLGRVHNSQEAHQAVEIARNAGFDNLNLDLMFGLPQQTLKQAQQDLQTALKFQPEHLSYYQLTIEPNTYFSQSPPELPDENKLWQMQQSGQNLIAAAGYTHYEVSAYAQPDKVCQHNLNYWEFGDYLGIGAGAHGKITNFQNQQVLRRWKKRHPEKYMESLPFHSGERILTQDALIFEFMLNALRLRQGIPLQHFSDRTGLPYQHIEPQISALIGEKLLRQEGNYLATTALGARFLNDVCHRFLPDTS